MSERIENTSSEKEESSSYRADFCVLTKWATIERLSQILLAKRDAVIDCLPVRGCV